MERKTRLIAIVLFLILQQVSGAFIPTNGPGLNLLTPQLTWPTPTGGQPSLSQQLQNQQLFGQLPFDKLQFGQLQFGQQRPLSPQTPSQQQQPPTQQCQGSCAARYEETIAALKQENQNLKDTNQRIQNENSQMKSALQEQRKTIALYLNRIEALEKQNNELRSSIQSLKQQINKPQPQPNPQPQPQPPVDAAVQSLVSSSKIMTSSQEGQQLKGFFPKRIKSVRLLYRASENGFSARKFHEKCDGIKDTLTLVQDLTNSKFGGYTPLSWKTPSTPDYQADNSRESFIFSLSLNEKGVLTQPQWAIVNNAQFGPTFGGGFDIYIADNANINQCTSKTGRAYSILSTPTRASFSAFGSNVHFRTKEWEVWALEFA